MVYSRRVRSGFPGLGIGGRITGGRLDSEDSARNSLFRLFLHSAQELAN